MSQPNLLELAKQGHPKAIESLINRQMQPKGITAKVSLSGDCLMIIAESKDPPDKAFLVDLIRKGMMNLKVEAIKRVVIRGQAAGQTTPTWREAFELQSGIPVEPVQISSSKNSKTSTTEKPSISKTKTKPEKFNELFNLFKNRNVERVILVVGTFVVTSSIWGGVSLLKAVKLNNSSIQVQQTPSPAPVSLGALPSSTSDPAKDSIPVDQTASPSPTSNSEEESVRKFIEDYLNEIINKGNSGTTSWCSESKDLESSFYAPRSAKILDIFASETLGSATIQLDSSNKGGMQITNNWKIYLKKETNASSSGGWCISLISKNS